MPESAKDSFRIEGSGPFGTARFDPPVVKDGSRIIGHGATTTEALDDEVVGTDTVVTHGDNLRASHQFYGASTTVSGAPEPAPGDPRVPRYPVVVRAELRYLLETLKHELQPNRPNDALWGRFAVEDHFFVAPTPTSRSSTAANAPSWPPSSTPTSEKTIRPGFKRSKPSHKDGCSSSVHGTH